jgi:hypothetical protein
LLASVLCFLQCGAQFLAQCLLLGVIAVPACRIAIGNFLGLLAGGDLTDIGVASRSGAADGRSDEAEAEAGECLISAPALMMPGRSADQ